MAVLKSLILIMLLATLLLVATTTARDLHEQKIELDDHKGGINGGGGGGEGPEEERGLLNFSSIFGKLKPKPSAVNMPKLKSNSNSKSKSKSHLGCEHSDNGSCPYGMDCRPSSDKCEYCCGRKLH